MVQWIPLQRPLLIQRSGRGFSVLKGVDARKKTVFIERSFKKGIFTEGPLYGKLPSILTKGWSQESASFTYACLEAVIGAFKFIP